MTPPSRTYPAVRDRPDQRPMTAPPPGGFCLVTLAAPTTRVDLAVPASVPIAALLPSLLRQAGESNSDGGAAHGGWQLRTTDGTPLDTALTLDAADVRDGDLLLLRPTREEVPTPLYDDLVELIADSGVRDSWRPRQTRFAAAIGGALAVLIALAAVVVDGGDQITGVAALVTAAGLLLVGGALSRAVGETPGGTLVAALAAPWAAAGAALVLGGPWGRAHLLLACAAVVVVAAVLPSMVGGGEPVAAALGGAGLLAGVGALVAVLSGGSPAGAAAVAAALGLAATTILPPLALRLARLPRPNLATTVDELAGLPGAVELDMTSRRVATARRLLTGLLTGCLTVTAVGVGVLLTGNDGADDRWGWALAGVLVALVLLRARLFRDRTQVSIPLFAGLGATLLGAAEALIVSRPGPLPAVVAAVTAVACLATGAAAGRWSPSPRTQRLVTAAETLLQISVVPLVLGVWDVYGLLMRLAG